MFHSQTKRDALSLPFEWHCKTSWSFCWSSSLLYHWEIWDKNEGYYSQSDNASSCQYNNKHSSGLFRQLADEFGLGIICAYGAAYHAKGAIDKISSFGVKDVLIKNIATCDLFLNSSETITAK